MHNTTCDTVCVGTFPWLSTVVHNSTSLTGKLMVKAERFSLFMFSIGRNSLALPSTPKNAFIPSKSCMNTQNTIANNTTNALEYSISHCNNITNIRQWVLHDSLHLYPIVQDTCSRVQWQIFQGLDLRCTPTLLFIPLCSEHVICKLLSKHQAFGWWQRAWLRGQCLLQVCILYKARK